MSSILIRESVLREGGLSDYHDAELTGSEISIGSGPSCAIRVLDPGIAADHATIAVRGRFATLRAFGGNAVEVNGVSVKRKNLQVGDRLDIGTRSIVVISPPAGFDCALQIDRRDSTSDRRWDAPFVTTLEQTAISKRRPAWFLALAILLGFLVVPLAKSVDSVHQLFGTSVPNLDRAWSTGDLTGAHQLVTGGNCTACHESAFRQVRDEACRSCHEVVQNHAREKLHEGESCTDTAQVPPACGVKAWLTGHALATERCGACHREHNAPGVLVDRSSTACAECHSTEPALRRAGDSLQPVTGFGPDSHPPFEVTLPISDPKDPSGGVWHRRILPLAGARERSNLTFSHVEHLDPSRVHAEGQKDSLQCGACHEPEDDGEHFKPIKMLTHCESCHELRFDDEEPLRRLPHGNTAEAIRVMQEHFLRKYVQPRPVVNAQEVRRLPDRERRRFSCAGPALSCAAEAFSVELTNQLRTIDVGCRKCHEVTDLGSGEPDDRFVVRAVRLAADFLPAEPFPHNKHTILTDAAGAEDLKGDAACLRCHASLKSELSTDVLIPDQDTCFDCHRDETVASRVSLYCADCHAYHPRAELTAMSD